MDTRPGGPGRRRDVARVPSPHVVWVERPGAGDGPRVEPTADAGQGSSRRRLSIPLRGGRVRMLNVPEIAAIDSPARAGRAAIRIQAPSSDPVGQGGQADARHVELHARQAVGRDRVECLVERRPRERLGEDAELHQTPPVTSASRRVRPIRPTARSPPGPAPPPGRRRRPPRAWGGPSRIVAANPSIWRL